MLNLLLTLAVTIFVFGLLIFIHEFGHYALARLFGVGVVEFAIGMGPKIATIKGKHNDFTIRAIPIGGFVNMVGEYDEEIPEEHAYKIPLDSKPVWKRILIVVAGPIMNLLLAFVIMFVLVWTGNGLASTIVGEFNEDSISNQYGLCVNDKIVEVNGKRIFCSSDLFYKITTDGIQPVDLKVVRNNQTIILEDVVFGSTTEDNIQFGTVDFKVYGKEKNFYNVIYESFWQSVSTVYMTIDSLVDTFTGRYGIDAVNGPIAVGSEINNTISQSQSFVETVQQISTLTVFISVSLGIFNLLPIPVLDGGRLLFYIIEAIFRKPLPKKVEQSISAFFTILLFALMIFVALKDLMGLF